jgi:hypothetical protein
MSTLEILNAMARLDGERTFASSDIGNELDILFRSVSEADSAFRFTDEIKSKISIQVAETNVPAEWTEMINAYPETQSLGGVKDQGGATFISRVLASFGANRGAWGGGFVTACLVLILIDPSGESDPTLGAGMAASQGDALLGLRGSSVQAASQTLSNDSSSSGKVDGLMSELKQREEGRCSDSELESEKGEDLDQVPACSKEAVEP